MDSRVASWFMSKVMRPLMGGMDRWERHLVATPGVHRALPDAPVRFEIMRESMKRGRAQMEPEMMGIMPGILRGMRSSMRTLQSNPDNPSARVPDGFLNDLETYTRSLGVASVGYTRVPEQWIFKGKALLHLNAIVLTMEMDKVRIDTAPSIGCKQAVMEIYRDLGYAANDLAAYVRRHGYSAHAAHPLMGPTLYPPLTQLAGLGWLSASGLMITPEFGPRVRLAAVVTNIENLPFSTHNDHAWVAGFCDKCGICIRECPTKAIYEQPIHHESGRITCVDNDLCFPYFNDHHGCSVCIKVCPFNDTPYDRIKAAFLKEAK